MYEFVGGATLRMSARPSVEVTACPDVDRAPCAELLAWLEGTWRDPVFAAAVELASPALAGQVHALLAAPHPCPRATRRAVMALLRYRLRSTSRATPFGLFAGVAALHVGHSAASRIGDRHRAVARVDHRWLTAVIEEFRRGCDGERGMPVVMDGRAVVRDGRLVLTDAATPSTDGAGDREVSVRLAAPVAATLLRAREPVTRSELLDGLAADFPAANPRAIERMITALLAEGFLVEALHPPMTAPDPLAHVLDTATSAGVDHDPEVAAVLAGLQAIGDLLSGHDTTATMPGQRALRAAATLRMRELADEVAPLGVDLLLDADVSVPLAVAEEAAQAASALVRLAPEPTGPAAWRDYHRRFLDRYGIGAVVGLPELLYAGTGLGFPAGFRGTHFPSVTPAHGDRARRRAEFLARLAHAAAWDRCPEVELTDADLETLTAGVDVAPQPQPHTDVRVEVHAPTRAALDAGRFDLLVVGASRAAGTVTGRFLDLLDPDGIGPITATLRALPTATRHATRVQLSGPPAAAAAAAITRSAAVLDRHLVVGGHAPAGSLLPGDMAVSADAAGLYLVIAATSEPIEPTAFTALELVRCADPTLRFLVEIATSACAPCSPFAWDPAVRELPFLPRLRYRRTILSPARWTVQAADLPADTSSAGWRVWRDRWAVPDRVLLGQHDQRLGLDLTEPTHRRVVADAAHRAGRVTLLEAPAPDAFGWIDDHAHELVLPLATTAAARHPTRPRSTATSRPIPRTGRPRHSPGTSRWLSVHLACRPDHQTIVLTEHLPRLLTDLDGSCAAAADGAASVWFVRLTEPDHHLRVRLKLRDAHHVGQAAVRVAAWADRLVDAGLVGALQFHTYLPETGRYGSDDALSAAEAVFAADSAAAVAQLATTTSTSPPTAVQALTAASMLDLVTAFTDTPHDGWDWLIHHAPRTVTRLPGRDLRAAAIALAHPDRRHLAAALSGGGRVVAAWDHRRTALAAYRQILLAQGIDPQTVLPDLLHLHHARTAGPHLDREATCLHLARAAALSHRARAAHPRTAA
jgi:thiopeptide-type bacteriocin biosynthesis protein